MPTRRKKDYLMNLMIIDESQESAFADSLLLSAERLQDINSETDAARF
jgi:hypothetical protein